MCLDYAIGDFSAEHDHFSLNIEQFHEVRKQVTEAVERVSDQEKNVSLVKLWRQVLSNHDEYLAHLIRTKHQGGYYQYILNNLSPGDIVVIIDYKMKVELGMRKRETLTRVSCMEKEESPFIDSLLLLK